MTTHLKPSEYSISITGESNYQKAIRDVIFYKEMVDRYDLEYKDDKLTAELILEDKNKYDPGNAVRVDIEGKTVGYLARQDARAYRKELARLELTEEPCTCNAAVFGKREDFGMMMKFGVWLSIDPKSLEVYVKPERKKLFGIF